MLALSTPELKIAHRAVTSKGIDVPGGYRTASTGLNHAGMDKLGVVIQDPAHFVQSNDVGSVGAVETIRVEVGMVHEQLPKVRRQDDITIQVHPPAAVLKSIEPGIYGRALVETPAGLLEQVCLHQSGPVLMRHTMGCLVFMGSYDDELIEKGMVDLQSLIEEVVKPYAGCHYLQFVEFRRHRRRIV